jgi:methionyl-tRNA formyltransferase
VNQIALSNSQPEQPERRGPRVLFLGTPGDFSLPALEALLAAGLPVCGVALPAGGAPPIAGPIITHEPARAGRAALPLLTPFMNRTIAQVARERGIPLLAIDTRFGEEALARLVALQPEVICVACWPQRLPKALLDLLPLGCLNLHPALLPAYRGPSPGFWVLRNGERYTGATIHLMDEHLDTGDILLQTAFEIPDGITSAALEQRCAEVGAPLLAQAVRARAAGTATRTPQLSVGSSYYSWPKDEDFSVPVKRSARWAYNFLRGVADWGGPLELLIGAERFPVRQALDYQPGAVLGQPYRRDGAELWAQCAPGVLHVLLW